MPNRTAGAPAHRLRFLHLDREIDCNDGETIFQAARRTGIRIVGACGGRGACGSCMVRLSAGDVIADGAKIGAGRKWFHACNARPVSDCAIEAAPRSLAVVVRANVEAHDWMGDIRPDANVVAHDIVSSEPTLDDNSSDFDRIRRALPSPAEGIDLAAARALPQVLRENDFRARIFVAGECIVGAAAPGRRMLGLAIDLGTTNVVGFLLDLATGERIASLGIENPQVAWGADLVSRINYAIGGAAQMDDLRQAAATAINALSHDLALAVDLRAHDILDVAICGNTAMQHLLLGLPVRQLGRAPFVSALRDPMDLRARDLGLDLAPGACVHIAGNVGGFVGSDHVAALLATRNRWNDAATSLVMDIGTNTEISLIHHGEILSASCPSGPALEGGHISCGMRAANGAIERVRIAGSRLHCLTIGAAPAVGVCGSGILDAIAAARRLGILDKGGRIAAGHADVVEDGGRRAILLAPGVQVTQADIRAVQLAKAAVRTGVDLLLEKAGIEAGRIEHFVLAGAFGSYIDLASAIEIGLVPALPADRFAQVGNAAGVGVARMLASKSEREKAKEIAGRCVFVELSTTAQFQKRFIDNIGFRAVNEEAPS